MEAKHGIERSRVSPSFLHSNSTSHIWVFGAIAELIDNAYDPDVNAKCLWIDKEEIGLPKKTCLTITDNGSGLAPDKLLKMLSFGFCEKHIYEGKSQHQPIGHYGNGFKSGSMRIAKDVLVFTRHLGEMNVGMLSHYGNGFKSGSMRIAKDVLVFTRHLGEMSVGMLSQNYLSQIKAETVVVPMKRSNAKDTVSNLREITKYSLFKSEKSLLQEFEILEVHKTGTRLILYNLVADNAGQLELDFESDPTDILNPQTLEIDKTTVDRPIQEARAKYKTSLKEYCSILFLKPRMKIFLRGNKVKTKLMTKSLSQTLYDTYKPQCLEKPIKITYGFNCSEKSKEEYGIMMYHKNRLIKAFKKVGYQKQSNDLGVGVVGVVEVNFLQPIHNKQDFDQNERYNTFMTALAKKTNDYWNEKMNRSIPVIEGALPDWLWAQCDHCLKWRRLPDGINRQLPDKWYCYMNPDASHNRCSTDEEPVNEDEFIQPNQKTFKQENRCSTDEEPVNEDESIQPNQKTFKQEKEEQKRKSKVEEELAKEALKAKEEKLKEMYTVVISSQDTEKRERELLQKKLEEAEKTISGLKNKVVNKTTADNSPAKKSTPSSKRHLKVNKRKIVEITTPMVGKRLCMGKNEPNSTDQVLVDIDNAIADCSGTPNRIIGTPPEVLRLKAELQSVEAKLEDTNITLEKKIKKVEDSEQKLVQQGLSLKTFENKLKYTETNLKIVEDSLRISETRAKQSENTLQQTQVLLKNSEIKFADTQRKLEYSENQLRHIQTKQATLQATQKSLQDTAARLKLSEENLEKTQTRLRDKEAILQTTQAWLEDKGSRLKLSETKLEQTQKLLHDKQATLQSTQTLLKNTESRLKLSENELEQTQTRSENQLRNTQNALQMTQTSLQDTDKRLKLSENKLEQTETQLHTNQVTLQTTQTSLEDVVSRLKLSEKNLEQTRALLNSHERKVADTQAKFENSEKLLRITQTELQATQKSLEDTVARLKLSEEKLEKTQKLLRDKDATLQTTQAWLEDKVSRLKFSETKIEQTQTLLNDKQATLQTTQTSLEDKESRLKISENKLHEAERKLGDEKQNLESTETRLQDLQTNIYKLLSIIVPDADLGEVSDIDQIVLDMIDINQ